MNDQRDFEVILNSRFPLVAVETHEETRLITMVERVANIRSHALFVWSLTDGLRRRNHADLNAVRFKDTADRMLTLYELCEMTAGRVPLVVEIKSRFDGDRLLIKRIADIVRAYQGPLALMSFDPASL